MNAGIQLRPLFSTNALAESSEPQVLYVLLEATPTGLSSTLTRVPLNLCLVLDRSSSMRGERLSQVKEAAQRIVDQMSSDDHFSLITFNDRAEAVITAQRVSNRSAIKNQISTIQASGGTEMAAGLALALQHVQQAPLKGRMISHILLLTDGRTYGDESQCVQLARRAQDRKIGLTALGIGNEWNEDLLETMAARENSRTQYITSAQEIALVFAEELKRLNSITVQGVQMDIRVRPEGMLRSLDQVQPFIAPVDVMETEELRWVAKLGDWPGTDTQTFLMELVVPPLAVGSHPLLRLSVTYDLPGENLFSQEVSVVLGTEIRAADAGPAPVNNGVRYWLERVMAYRLQHRAWQDIESGRIEDATQRLRMAGTRLLEAGESNLARTVQHEATRLLYSGNTTAEGRKRIKYGTRGLMSQNHDQDQE
jgi:uncharacterized protein YegL